MANIATVLNRVVHATTCITTVASRTALTGTSGLISGLKRQCLRLQSDVSKLSKRHGSSYVTRQNIGVVGVPIHEGQKNMGVMYGPSVIREAGLMARFKQMGLEVVDHGDLKYESVQEDKVQTGVLKSCRTLGRALHKLSDTVCSIMLKHDQACVALGGDHSLTIGSLHGHAQAEPDMCVVWVDAHADINLPQCSPSGNLHGMVLSFLVHELRDYMPTLAGFEWVKPCMSVKDIAYIGIRDLDECESYIMTQKGITCFTMHDVEKIGVAETLSRSLDKINPKGDRPVHLSFDIDSFDPYVAPSTGTPCSGGLTYREGLYIAEELGKTGLVNMIDMVEVNPELGSHIEEEKTSKAAVNIICAALGETRMGYVPPDYQLPKP
ncbi:arginase, hepatic-like [Acanthaster planci]|uniref:Arginase n=1 Tax=Acanthaster planci TaxID=133434 RepID=A0A8B7Y8I9_ACAPL|nr:arginase, hepatic-like [Acanthaster planci]XP_022088667.1 arginase, hepatic-like [Acanthaster planci]XP_022088668.1 arginase, hepatic-like [Acanthaster planci]XP_022088669.1 arginase, hepatic-like [Acanthaster planci]XP_022088670.1 arginase, hepatic-like [Acanthaster planci]XP_022088671.1 arginase, hepatic-like [Acanthaster planci]